ncbi:MAG TPA: ester cyclase [Myxococcota bacterium]|nr:ester cyclase [Myxococcota bacterium]
MSTLDGRKSLDANIGTVIEKAIVASPFGNLVGMTCESIAEDRVRVRLPFRPQVTTIGDMVHGGAISALVDVAATAAAWATPAATLQARGSTVGFSISFLAPGRARDLVADARVVQRGKSLCVCEVEVGDGNGTTVARSTVTYRLALPPGESERHALVRAYAEAKSRQDAAGALALCTDDFSIETIPFGTASHGRDDSARQLALFFSVFPDYRAETEGMAESGESVSWWGHVCMTFAGGFLGLEPTGRSAKLPAFSVFDLRKGRLVRERFHFDLSTLCEQIGVPVETLAGALRALRG